MRLGCVKPVSTAWFWWFVRGSSEIFTLRSGLRTPFSCLKDKSKSSNCWSLVGVFRVVVVEAPKNVQKKEEVDVGKCLG